MLELHPFIWPVFDLHVAQLYSQFSHGRQASVEAEGATAFLNRAACAVLRDRASRGLSIAHIQPAGAGSRHL
jgi:hypothetical protein